MGIIEKIISIIAPFRCLGCGLDGELVCEPCRATKFVSFDSDLPALQPHKAYVLYEYGGMSARLVRALKFDRAKHAAVVMAQQLHEQLPQVHWDVVTYLPTAPKRARQRGYDHAELIARHFAGLRRLDFKHVLTRAGNTRQVGSTRSVRQKQLAGAFLPRGTVLNEHVLIIDDVMTTGSSLNEAAKVIKSVGARQVTCAVFAAKK